MEGEPQAPSFLLRVPAAYGLTRVEITSATNDRDAVQWDLGAPTELGVWGLISTREEILPEPFVPAHPELAGLFGLQDSIAELNAALDRRLAAPVAVAIGGRTESGAAAPATDAWLDPDVASAMANLREQVLLAIRIGRINDVALIRGYVDDEHGTRQVLEDVWLDFNAFLTHATARTDEWRLQQRWYSQRPRWEYRSAGVLPRRAEMVAAGPLRIHYGLYPRGMHRPLYGSYLLYVAAHLELAQVSGPPPLATLNEARAREILETPDRGGFSTTEVQRRMRDDPAGALCDRALNGIHAFALGGPDPYAVSISFAGGTNHVPATSNRRSAGTFLPDVDLRFAPDGDGLTLSEITVTHGAGKWSAEGPADPLWPQLVHVARGALTLAGEIDVHVMAHLLAEHVQVALHTSLPPSHPVRRLLAPHVDGADVINYAGDWLVLGEDGVLSATTPLTPDDVAARAAHALATAWHGYRTFGPRDSLCTSDRYAGAAKVFWAALEPYVRGSLEGVKVDADVVGFASLLTEKAPPTRSGEGPKITLRDPEDLVQFCRFVVFYTTFLHGWVNDAQWDDGGNPDLAPLAPRALPNPLQSYTEWAEAAAPSRVNAAYQMIIANALTRFDVGLALHDDLYPSAPPGFRVMVANLPAPFATRHPTDRRLEKGWIRSRLNS